MTLQSLFPSHNPILAAFLIDTQLVFLFFIFWSFPLAQQPRSRVQHVRLVLFLDQDGVSASLDAFAFHWIGRLGYARDGHDRL